MNTLSHILYDVLPAVGALLLILGITFKRTNYMITALWLSLIGLLLHYQTAGGEILGNYFGYKQAAIYSTNLLVLMIALLCLGFKFPPVKHKRACQFTGLIAACLVVGSFLLLTNLWINAQFIENRRAGTPVLQVARFTSLNYCSYRYVFYKVRMDGKIGYMCPNHFGIIPSIGTIDVAPGFIFHRAPGHHT